MLLTIHDANLKKVAFIDNDKQETLNYYDDTWTRSLETGSSTFEFTVYKKAIKSDTAINKTYNLLNERAFVSFRHHGKSYVFNVMTVEENEQTIKCYCENLNLELINEYANPYKATKAMSFVEYCNAMDLLNFTHLSVGINEISDQKRTLEWDGQDTKLARLLSLAKKFDAEIDFDTQLNTDSSIKTFKVNVYHENDDKHQGVGRVRNDIQLTYGKNLKSITRKIDKTGVYNAIRPTGKRTVKNGKGEEVEEIVTIGSLGEWSENNKDGVREFYQQGDMLYAPLSMQMYPSTFTSSTTNDQWIRKDMEVDSDSPSVIRASAIANLRKNAYPALTYEVDGFIDVEIGDTIRIYDDGFTPILLVQARVSHQKISFTNPASNQTTFANFKALENNLSDGIQAAFERLFEASKPYLIKLSTDNGIIFKNQIGQSIVTPTLYKGGKPVVANVTWRWALDGNTSTGMTYTVLGSNVTDTATLTVAAYIGNDEVAVDEISFVNVLDGTMGTPGKPGQDGRTPYVHTAWSDNETGTSGFSLDSSINKLYIGIYTDFEPMDSQDPRKYKWTKIKGDKGDKGDPGQRGLDGLQGEKGEQGIPGEKGADGKTQYTHIAYANSADGRTDFSTSASNRSYIGMYVDFNSQDSTNPSDYAWTLVKGADGANGIAGKAGVDGRTPYLHIAYATSNNGSQGFSTTDSVNKTYIGTYTDYVQADSTDYRVYKWTLIKGADGNGIANVTNYYLATTASTGVTRSTAGWTTTPQTITSAKRYHWNYRVELYTDGTSKTTEPAIIGVYGDTGARGIQGIQGIRGEQGIPGEKGADGRTQYTHIAYADNATGGGFSQTDQTKAYIGMYQDFTAINSTNPTSYRWSKWKGSDGAQGIPGPKGADGRTPYIHWAYSDSADGTGLTTSDNGQRYIGHYSDYTQADSTDKTKYRWADRWARLKLEDNLLLNSSFNQNLNQWKGYGISIVDGKARITGELNKTKYIYQSIKSQTANDDVSQVYIASISVKVTNYVAGSINPFLTLYIDGRKNDSTNTWFGGTYRTANRLDAVNNRGVVQFATTFRINVPRNQIKSLDFYIYARDFTGEVEFEKVSLRRGDIDLGWQASPEDIRNQLNSKADQAFTQEQLNLLNERAQILDAELKAKASMDALSDLEKAYQSFVKSNADSQAKAEADLAEAGRRIELLVTQFGGFKELKTFIDTYMSSSNEGLIIGKNDASSTIKVSSDRISMFSAGKEVMYISQGVIHIDNGIFTASVQIGKFRTEQYHLNLDMNVIRYVG
ncbi:TPA: phage tail protein [Streptococcus suis]|uniref:phage tail spike protein n=1 Tax=Streptococcus suis TaxID=1307 RepID=UPI0025AFE299|nr:phage tail spike protein [Streptococcus suis]MDN2949061.1 phage tail protein [Streptococcus suis]HEL1563471.1 phage tail protein [Streptococcus suis]HEL1908946.1 phage tail protein [Streptococcus suis]HEL1917770.1 phage tail protein [Streptococcus suis]